VLSDLSRFEWPGSAVGRSHHSNDLFHLAGNSNI
jgi:hypothetical protein